MELWETSSLRDLSEEGAAFLSERDFEVGLKLELKLLLPVLRQPLVCVACVVWLRPIGNLTEYGVTFELTDERTRQQIAEAVGCFATQSKSQTPESEQRRYPRIREPFKAVYCFVDSAASQIRYAMRPVNISMSGARFLSQQLIDRGRFAHSATSMISTMCAALTTRVRSPAST